MSVCVIITVYTRCSLFLGPRWDSYKHATNTMLRRWIAL